MPTYGGWGPPAIDPSSIGNLLDPYIERQKQLRTGSALAQGFKALQSGDYAGMAATMQQLAADNPTLAVHLLSTYETEQARKRQEEQFKQTFGQTGRHQAVEEYIAANTPRLSTEEEPGPYSAGTKKYAPIGFPPGYVSPFGQPGTTPAPAAVAPLAPAGSTTAGPAGQPPPAASAPATGSPAQEVVPPPQTSQPTPAVRTQPLVQQPAPIPAPPPPIAAPPPAPPAPPPAPVAPVQPAAAVNPRKIAEQVALSGMKGPEVLAALPPIYRNAVQQVINLERPVTDFVARGKDNDRKLYEDLATAADPTYSPSNYYLAQRHLAGYATLSGSSAGARINNLNVASGHLEQLEKLNNIMSSGKFDIPLLNQVYQKLNIALGKGVDVTNWNLMRQMVAPELAKVIGGAGGLGVEERQKLANSISASASPAQAIGALATTRGTMAERYAVGHQQYNDETYGKRPFKYAEKLSGNSMKIMLNKEGIDVSIVTPNDLKELLKSRESAEDRALFDEHYGSGAAERILDGLR